MSKLKRSFSTANAARFAMPQEDKTLKKTQIRPPQNTQPRCIRRNQLGTIPYAPRQIPIPLKQYSGNPYVLELFCGQSITFPRGRPSVRVLVRRIRALNYVVEVFPFPNNDIDCHPDEDWIIVSKIGDTSLRIILIPFNRLKKKATEETRTAPF